MTHQAESEKGPSHAIDNPSCISVSPIPGIESPLTPGSTVIPTDKIRLQTFRKSALGIGGYPIFKYNAKGGGGHASITKIESGRVYISFDVANLHIPSLTWRTGRWLGAPLPPVFKIRIIPSQLEGFLELSSGKVFLDLSADFRFSAAGLYKVALHVDTKLSTESAVSKHHNRTGSKLDHEGNAVLVGVGEVSRTKSWLINQVLRLPTDVLGLMNSRFTVIHQDMEMQKAL